MTTSHKVDVVIADEGPLAGWEDLNEFLGDPEPGEQVDVTPDPRRRVILVAPTKPRGKYEARTLGIEPVAIVTPRTPDAARGHTADEIVWSDDLTDEDREALMPHVLPAIATTQEC